jgi:uncharacterized protein (DUF1330 family)
MASASSWTVLRSAPLARVAAPDVTALLRRKQQIAAMRRWLPKQERETAYAKLAVAATAPFGARFLARGNPAVAFEHGLKERTVITEYPSLEKATASYGSPAYQEALKALGDGAVRDVRIIEGSE